MNFTKRPDLRTLKPVSGALRLAAPPDAAVWDLASALHAVALDRCFSLSVFICSLSLLQTQAPAAPMVKMQLFPLGFFDLVCISSPVLSALFNWCLFGFSEASINYSPR